MVASKEYKENYIQSLDVLDDYPELDTYYHKSSGERIYEYSMLLD